jgi:nucleotide-binding universal stress UspA family protein
MERIVVPLDGSARSERALPIAQAIARRMGAEVRLVEVVPIEELEDAARYLDRCAALLRGVETGTEVLITQPGRTVAESLARVVGGASESMLCMTSHGRSGLGSAVLGSTAEDVLRRSDRPVLVVGRECALPWPGHRRTLLVPIDGSEPGEQILGRIAEVVDRSGLQPTLVQVAHPFDVEEANHAGDALEHARRQLLAMGVDAKTEHRFASNVPLTLDEVARGWGAALIVMASSVRPGASRTLLGSVTMSTIRHSPCPVLVYPGRVLAAAAPG